MSDKTTAKKAMFASVAILHVWGCMIVYAVTFGDKDSGVLSDILGHICFGIGMTLAALVGDKGLQSFIASRYGMERTEATTTTITTAPTTAAESKGDIVL